MRWFVLIIFIFMHAAWAKDVQTYDLGNGLIITQEQLDELRAAFKGLDKDEIYYHWADREDRAWRWIKQGYVDAGELDVLTKPTGSKQTYGGGIYMAADPVSTSDYGNVGVAFEFKKGTLVFNQAAAKKILGHGLNEQQQAELGRYLPMIRKVTGDWVVLSSPSLANDVSYAGRYGGVAKNKAGSMNLQAIISELAQEDPQRYGYLESLTHLMNYQDGVSFARSVRVNPQNPWAEFDPHTFEDFKNTERQLFTEAAQGKNFGIAKAGGGFGAKGTDADTWADGFMKKLDEVHNSVLGTPSSDFRSGPVVGSGDGSTSAAGGGRDYLEVTDAQYAELMRNQYLDVELVGEQNNMKMVRIRYPEALRDYQRFKDILSPELEKEIEAASHGTISPADRATLNQKFLRQLVKERLVEAFTEPVNSSLFRDLVSIHPYQDANGRSLRLMQRLAASDAHQEIPYFTMSDLDLMTSTSLQDELLKKGGQVYERWLGDMLAEVQAAKREGRVPRLLEYPHDQRVAETLSPIAANPTWTHGDLEAIRKREWAKLLEKWVGPNWQTMRDADLGEILAHPEKYLRNTTRADFEKSVQKLLEDSFKKDIWNVPYMMRYADRSMFRTWMKAVDTLPDMKAVPELPDAWDRLKELKFSSQELSESEKLHFASRIIRSVDVAKDLSDAETAKLIGEIAKQNDAESLLKVVGDRLRSSGIAGKKIGPETARAIDDLFAGFSCTNSPDCAGHLQLWRVLKDDQKLGPHSLQFLQKNITTFSKLDDLNPLFTKLLAAPENAYQAALKRTAIQAGIKAFRDNPAGEMSQVPAFFKALNPRELSSRDIARLMNGIRLSPKADISGLEERLLNTDLTTNELRLIENRIHRVNMGKAKADKLYYSLLRTLVHHKPDSPLLDEALNTVWKGLDPRSFLKEVRVWTPGLQKLFEQDPDRFRGMSSDVTDALSLEKNPGPGIDKVMAWALSQQSLNADGLVKVASRMNPGQTTEFDKVAAARLLSHPNEKALVDYAKSRPNMAGLVAEKIEAGTLPFNNYGDFAEMVKDRPKALAGLFDGAISKGASPEQLNRIWNTMSSDPNVVTPARQSQYIIHAATEDELFDYLIKNPKALRNFFEKPRANAQAREAALLERMVKMENPPFSVRSMLLAELHKGELGERILKLLGSQDSLKPWQRDLFNRYLSISRDKTKFSLGFDFGYQKITTGARREMAELYLQRRGWINPSDTVKGQMEIYDLMKKSGISPEDFAKGDKAATQALAKAAVANGLSENGVHAVKGSYGYEQWNTFRDAVVKDSLTPPQVTQVNHLFGRAAKGYGEQSPDEDLVQRITGGRGKISQSALDRWSKTGSCRLGVTQFFRRIKSLI